MEFWNTEAGMEQLPKLSNSDLAYLCNEYCTGIKVSNMQDAFILINEALNRLLKSDDIAMSGRESCASTSKTPNKRSDNPKHQHQEEVDLGYWKNKNGEIRKIVELPKNYIINILGYIFNSNPYEDPEFCKKQVQLICQILLRSYFQEIEGFEEQVQLYYRSLAEIDDFMGSLNCTLWAKGAISMRATLLHMNNNLDDYIKELYSLKNKTTGGIK